MYPPSENGLQKTLAAQLNAGETSQMTLNNTTGIQNKPGIVVIDRIDTSSKEKDPSVREYIEYTGVSGNNLTGLTRGMANSTDQDHLVGAVVEFIPDVTVFQAINDTITTQHNSDGTHAKIQGLDNNEAITQKDSTGTARSVAKVNSSDILEIGDSNLAGQQFNTPLVNNTAIQQKDSTGTARDVSKIDSSDVLTVGNNTTPTKIKAGSNTTSGHTVPNVADDTFALLSNLYNSIYRQALINGAFDVWQRGTSFTPNDDTYTADSWTLLTETNAAWTIARDTDVPDGFIYSAKLSNVTANNQVALVQFIENINAKKFQNKKVSLSFYAKTIGTEIANLRAAVLSWTGTADSLTSDVIATWAQDGTNPTWATNWTMENTPSNLALTSSYQQFKIENINIDTSEMTNLAVVIWVDDGTIASGDDFYITGVQLNVGETALSFQPKSFDDELRACMRYYENSYPYGTAVGTADGYEQQGIAHAYAFSSSILYPQIIYRVKKRITPTVVFYAVNSPTGSGTINNIRNNTDSTLVDVSGCTFTGSSNNLGFITKSSPFLTGKYYGFNWTANAEL